VAVDRDGVEELIPWVDATYIRFCWRCRLPFTPDARIYRDAGRACPRCGVALRGYLEQFRDDQGLSNDPGLDDDSW
jgi:DNA-directed RNA polymerase subunit RPC12/RpoP